MALKDKLEAEDDLELAQVCCCVRISILWGLSKLCFNVSQKVSEQKIRKLEKAHKTVIDSMKQQQEASIAANKNQVE